MYNNVVILCNIIQPFHGHVKSLLWPQTAVIRDSNGDSNGDDLYEIVSLAF